MQMRVLQPAEQASHESLRSLGQSSSGRLQASSSNVSQLTAYTDLTSPSSVVPEPRYERPDIERIRTPEEANRHDSYAFASPMSVTSPASTNGTKRTASGHVKNAPSLPSTPHTTTFAGKRSRADSLSSTGSRAGELAWTLKARLGYAMAKVQHGWEHKNIREVEALAAHSHRHSMSQLDYSSRRPLSSSGGLSNGAGRLSMYEPASKRLSASIDLATPPRLQPAPDIRPASQRQHHYYPISSSQSGHPGQPTAMSPPHTPLTTPRRPPTLRTELQTAEAEREALQALFQLGSPHSSQVPVQMPWQQQGSQASSSQASPLRAEFGAVAVGRKVTFARGESESDSGVESGGGEGVAVLEGVVVEA